MDQVNTAAPEGGDGISLPVAPIAPAAEGTITTREAAQNLAKARWAKRQQPEQPPSSEQDAPAPVNELSPQGDDAAPVKEQVPGETEGQPEPAQPLIEPPRSWTKDEKERFASLPRETQEYVAQREQEREREVRRSQNEVADKTKAIEAERQQLVQARQKYEVALPMLLEQVQQQHMGEFSDIKTSADVQNLVRNDPARYLLWDAQQKQLSAIINENREVQERHVQEQNSRIEDFTKREDAAILEHIPELADPDKSRKLTETAALVLRDVGFTEQELSESYNGRLGISLRDHRMQRILFESMKYREAKVKSAAPAPKPVPLVQRPGTAQPQGSAAQSAIQALSAKLDQSGSARDAARLITERRKATARH